jgi:hypothetical protein
MPRANVTGWKFLSPQLEGVGTDPPFRTEFRGGQIAVGAEATNRLNVQLQTFGHILHVQKQTGWFRFSVLGWLEWIGFHADHAACATSVVGLDTSMNASSISPCPKINQFSLTERCRATFLSVSMVGLVFSVSQ